MTAQRWADLEGLFGPTGACGGCWCMWWKRTPADFSRYRGGGNKRAFKWLVERGDLPGLIGYRDDTPVAWIAVEPRERYLRLARSRNLAPIDAQPVWSVTCFFVKAGYRHQGLSRQLLAAARRHVARHGGRLLEGYPKDTARGKWAGANAMWMGTADAFAAAGFREVARRTPTRPIMRARVRPVAQTPSPGTASA